MGKTVLKSNLTGRTFRRNLLAVRLSHAPEPVRRAGPAGDPDGRPRPRDVLARPRRRHGRRAGRLWLGRQPVRRDAAVRARGRARGRTCPTASVPRSTASTSQIPTKTTYRAYGLGPGLHPQQLRALRAQRRPARGLDRGSPRGSFETAGSQTTSRVTVLRQDGTKLNQVGAVGGLGGGGADLRRALHGRARIRGDVPPDRSAVHARPLEPGGAEGRRRAEDPGLLGVPAPGRQDPAARHRARRGQAPRCRYSTGRAWPRRARSRT